VVAACASKPVTPTVTKVLSQNGDVDLLFVIDNSLTTANMQVALVQSLGPMVADFETSAGSMADLHVGVVSTTVGTGNSSVSLGANCPTTAPGDDGLLHDALIGADTGGAVDGVECSACNLAGQFITATDSSCPLEVALGCMAELGTSGCGFEEPLEAMKRALDGSQPANAGFLRDDAYFAVVILTNQDDCSVKNPDFFSVQNAGGLSDFRCTMYGYQCDEQITPAQSAATYTGCTPLAGSASPYLQDTSYYEQFLAQLKDPSRLVVSVIAGADAQGNMPDPAGFTIQTGAVQIPGQPVTVEQDPALLPSCETTIDGTLETGRPGLRLADFVTRIGERAAFYSVCQSDYTESLADTATRTREAMTPCLEGAIDATDPRCTVEFVDQPDATHQHAQAVPECTTAPSGSTCWTIAPDPVTCANTTMFPSQLAVHIANGGAPAGWFTQVTCAVTAP